MLGRDLALGTMATASLSVLLCAAALVLAPPPGGQAKSSAVRAPTGPAEALRAKPGPKKRQAPLRTQAPRHFLGFRPHRPSPDQAQELKILGLKALPDGSYLFRGTKKDNFQARIFPDGSVEFFDDASFKIEAKNICIAFYCPVAQNPNFLKSKKKQEKDRARRRRIRKFNQVASRVLLGALTGTTGFAPVAGQDPNEIHSPIANAHAFHARRPSFVYGAASASGRFGYLPAPKAAQLAFLERSFEFRLKLAVEDRIRILEKALSRLHRELRAIEATKGQELASRHQRLLSLWREFDARHQDQAIQDAIVQKLHRSMGEKLRFAREQMAAFARRVFPQSSTERLSAKQLKEFNQGRSGNAVFRPYQAALQD